MWMSDGRDCAGELRQSLSVEDVDGKQDSLSYYIERIEDVYKRQEDHCLLLRSMTLHRN